MFQFATMSPIQGGANPLKAPAGSTTDAAQSGLTGEDEALSFERILQQLSDADSDGTGLLLVLQQLGVLPEPPPSLPTGGTLLPAVAGTSGNALPPVSLQSSRLEALQRIEAETRLQALDPRQLQQLLGDKPLPEKEQLALLVARGGLAAEGSHTLEGRGLAEFSSQLQALGLPAQHAQPAAAPRALLAPPVQVPVGQPGWDNAVGERIQWMLSRNVQQAEIKLMPPELGPMEIRVSLQNDQTSVHFLAHHGATRDALEAAIPRLRELFGEINLNLANVDVSQRQDGGGAAQGGSTGGAGTPGHTEDGGYDPLQEVQGAVVRLQSRGLLDIYA